MTRRLIWICVAMSGCGRLGFATTDGQTGDNASAKCVGAHDEDGDGIPDVCDVCPTVFDPDQLDLGETSNGLPADGVGDACDPRPGIDGDYIAIAEMNFDPLTPTYTSYDGATSYPGNDALRIGATANNGHAFFMLPPRMTRFDYRATVVVPTAAVQQWFGAWYDVGTGRNQVFASGAHSPTPNPNTGFALKEQSTGTDRYSSQLFSRTAMFAPGERFRVVVDTALVTGTADLIAVVDLSNLSSQTSPLVIAIPVTQSGLFEVNRMIVDFDYFVVYAIR